MSRPGDAPPGQDRWATTRTGVIVLDGASAFDPGAPPADQYVDALLRALTGTLDSPADLPTILGDAISAAAAHLRVQPGGPSATALALREMGEWLELAVLGDSTAVLGFHDGRTERVTDARIAAVGAEQRTRYQDRLRSGHGYDHTHRALLADLQRRERAARNQSGGYWIAEADPRAAHQAIIQRHPLGEVAWCILATDGAQRGIDQHHIDWAALAKESSEALRATLQDLHTWEAEHDPDGVQLPRAKRHDDKTLVTWSTYG